MMSDIFDVDCPHTPDGDGDGSKRTEKAPSKSRSSRPLPRSRPTSATALCRARSHGASSGTVASGVEVAAGHSAARKAMFSPRSRGGKLEQLRRVSSSAGLEPEEYIAPSPSPLHRSPAAAAREAPNSATGVYHVAHNSGYGRGAHSAEVFGAISASTNPFDACGSNRERTYSGNLWREEIVDEGDDKASKYYGPDLHEKQGLGGPAAKSTTAIITNPSHGLHVEQDIGGNQKHPLPDSRDMPVLQGNHSHGISKNIENVNGQKHGSLNTSIYHQAASMNSAGYYTTNANVTTDMVAAADDYSFSNVDLGYLPPGVTFQGNTPPGMINANKEGKGSFRDKLLQWCISALVETSSSNNNTHGHLPPNMNDRSCDWGVANGIRLDGMNKKQGGLGSTQKLGLGLLLMVVVCTIFGVVVSEVKKANADTNVGHEGSQLHGLVPVVQLAPPAPVPSANPTLQPSISPILEPTTPPTTPSPTRMPVTESPIADNYAAHSKTNFESDGITRPTRSPVTNRASSAPLTDNPTESPTVKVASVQAAPGGAGSCTDNNDGFFSNHLGNPFNCTWLHNGKSGYTDRKDKNCGGRPVVDELNGGTMVYETSELGRECPKTCRLYNGCVDPGTSTGAGAFEGMTVMEGQVNPFFFSTCTDSQGHFSNHLSNLMTCEWLYNDIEGKTDRKDKNCGTAEYPVTELGRACKSTCSIYDGGKCTGGEVMVAMASSGGEQKSERTGSEHEDHLNDMEDLVELEETEEKEEIEETEESEEPEDSEEMEEETVEESYTSSPPKKNQEKISNTNTLTSCHDAEGKFLNHESNPKYCEWLFNDKEGRTDRKDMNCGTAEHPVTELGVACRKTCSVYDNGCATDVQLHELIMINSGQVVRSYSSPSYSFSLTSSIKCTDGDGEYIDHKNRPKPCTWLEGGEDPRLRQQMNCGPSTGHITELGMKCPWSCRVFNDCQPSS